MPATACLSDAQLARGGEDHVATTSRASRSPAWTRSRAGRCSRARCSASGRTSARCRSRRIRCRARSRCSTPPAIRPPSSSSRRNPKLDTMTFDPKQYQSRIATVGVDHGRHRREPGEVQGQGRQDHHDARHRGRLHHAAQQRALLPAAGEAVRPGRRGQLHPLLHDSRLRPRLRPVQREDRQPDGAAATGSRRARRRRGSPPTDGNPNANRARPLCEWPTWPKFTGAPGTEGSAASFTCVAP